MPFSFTLSSCALSLPVANNTLERVRSLPPTASGSVLWPEVACCLAVSCTQLPLGLSMPGCFLLLLDSESYHLKQHILPIVPPHPCWYPVHIAYRECPPICISCCHLLVRSLLMSLFRKMPDSCLWLLSNPRSGQSNNQRVSSQQPTLSV